VIADGNRIVRRARARFASFDKHPDAVSMHARQPTGDAAPERIDRPLS
jgi:hypothetical protein